MLRIFSFSIVFLSIFHKMSTILGLFGLELHFALCNLKVFCVFYDEQGKNH